MENSNISWTHNTQNFWLGCDKVNAACAHCYIDRTLRQQHREPWGKLYLTQTWGDPAKWQRELRGTNVYKRVFACSESDFFHAQADEWRPHAWEIIRHTPNLVYQILTKRPERILRHLPDGWGDGWPNVWLGTSIGDNKSVYLADSLRKVPAVVRFLSCEPLIEDISGKLDITGINWMIVGGESGGTKDGEYLYDPKSDWREAPKNGRRTMKLEWAHKLLEKSRAANIPYFFKQITAVKSGQGEDALEQVIHEFPDPPNGGVWAPVERHDLVQLV
jgi:protein gp37